MSKIEVDKVDPQSGTALEIGTSGDTVTVPSGVGLTLTDSTLLLPTTITSTTEVKTNKISPATGVAFALGDSGDTFTVPSGATIDNLGTATGFGGDNTPAFSATMSGAQSFSDGVSFKVDFDTETFDTAGAYDPLTNQRFTVPAEQGGKYYIHGKIFWNDVASTDMYRRMHIFKNGVNIGTAQSRTVGSTGRDSTTSISAILPLDATDYIEIYGISNSGAGTLNGSYNNDVFEGFKLVE